MNNELVGAMNDYISVKDMTKTIGAESDELHESSYDDMVNLVFVKGTAIVASICQHKNSLGYDIEFDTPVSKGEYISSLTLCRL